MTTVSMIEERVGEVPVIHAAPQDRLHQPLPTVVLFHGYTSSKELNTFLAYMLARRGCRVVLPEADLHGERYDGDEDRRLRRFWDILGTSIDELPACCEHYRSRGLVDGGRIGVAGTSMGGFAALGCMVRYPWIRATAAYMASGYFLELSRTLYPPLGSYGPANAAEHARRMRRLAGDEVAGRLERIADRPLLLWHGQRDDIVPYGESERLREELAERGLDKRLEFIGDPRGVHKLSMAASVAGVEFFARHL